MKAHVRNRPDGKRMPIEMRKPRQCRRGWFYINPRSIDVVTASPGPGIATLSRRQLVAALKVMGK